MFKIFEFYESYGETHFGVFFMPHSVYDYIMTKLTNSGGSRGQEAMPIPRWRPKAVFFACTLLM